MLRIVLTVIAVVAAASTLSAQLFGPVTATIPDPPGPDSPSFEVVSVKPAGPPGLDGRNSFSFGVQPSGRFVATGVPLNLLIQQAYGLRGYQLVGLSPPMANSVYAINAQPPEGTDRTQVGAMVRRLLAERFTLKARVETRELPVYVLTLDRDDGRLGPKLTRSTEDCDAILAERKQQAAANPGTPFVPPKPGERPLPCTSRSNATATGGVVTIVQTSSAQPFESLVNLIAGAANRHVIDRTGLTGRFDYELSYSPTREAGGLSAAPPGAATPGPNVDGGLSIVESVKQLGLKLQGDRAPVQVLVVDSVEPPTPD